MTKAIFLDRDGVINQKAPPGQYITSWRDMRILPGVADAIALFKQAGYSVIVVTNQRAVAKGLITASELEDIHRRLREQLSASGAVIDDIYYCPHELEPPCNCRKPEPGMLLKSACDHKIDLNNSWMVGDSARDVEAGKRAGCRTVRLVENDERDPKADAEAESLLAAAHKILEWNESAGGMNKRDINDSRAEAGIALRRN